MDSSRARGGPKAAYNAGMSSKIDIDALLALGPEERAELAEILCDSLSPEDDLGLTPAQWEEIERRLDELQAHPELGLTLAQLEVALKQSK